MKPSELLQAGRVHMETRLPAWFFHALLSAALLLEADYGVAEEYLGDAWDVVGDSFMPPGAAELSLRLDAFDVAISMALSDEAVGS